MPKACGLVTSWMRCVPMSSCVWPLASVRTVCASQTFSKRVIGPWRREGAARAGRAAAARLAASPGAAGAGRLQTGEDRAVRVAFTGLAMATVLPGILREFHRRIRASGSSSTKSPPRRSSRRLQAGEIGCGFFHPDAPTPGLRTRLLLRERNGVLLPADHPLAKPASLRLRDLAATPFVLVPARAQPGFYDRMLAAFAAGGRARRASRRKSGRAPTASASCAPGSARRSCVRPRRAPAPEVAFRPARRPGAREPARCSAGLPATPTEAPTEGSTRATEAPRRESSNRRFTLSRPTPVRSLRAASPDR
jgi:DNA-binding transcriptional LysR family regulator